MEVYEFILIAAILGVVSIDAIIRLHVAPNRRDQFLGQLLTMFVKREHAPPNSLSSSAPAHEAARKRASPNLSLRLG
jgi:hypothetical protein